MNLFINGLGIILVQRCSCISSFVEIVAFYVVFLIWSAFNFESFGRGFIVKISCSYKKNGIKVNMNQL